MEILPGEAPKGRALGIALARFALQNGLRIIEVHASDTVRAIETRKLALAQLALSYPGFPSFDVVAPSRALWEHRKGALEDGGLEGMLRSEAYPDAETKRRAAEDPNFRHGAEGSGAETPNEAGKRWVEQWFYPLTEQSNFQSRENAEAPIPTMVAFGHNLVTDRGISRLMHEEHNPLPGKYKVGNGAGLVLAEFDSGWAVVPDRIVPTAVDLAAV
jgi:broad specificity phosphatase PhoE